MRLFQFAFVTAVAVSFSCAALAGSPPESPSTPAAFESTFAGYTPFQEHTAGRWREHNDEMGRVGGHAGHLKSSPPATSEAPTESGSITPGAVDHGAHHPK